MNMMITQALKRGINAHNLGNIQEAEEHYRVVLNSEPKHPDANHNLGLLMVGTGKTEQALPFFKTAIAVNADVEQFWVSYISALIELKLNQSVKSALKKAKKTQIRKVVLEQLKQTFEQTRSGAKNYTDQEPPSYQMQPIIQLYHDGQMHQVLKFSEELIRKYPMSVGLLNIYGVCLTRLKQFDEALIIFKKILRSSPNSSDTHNNIGNVLKGMGKEDNAKEYYEKAVKLDPNCTDAYTNIGSILLDKGDINSAVRSFKRSIKINPDHFEAHVNLADALAINKDWSGVINSCTKVLATNPLFTKAHYLMGNAKFNEGEFDEAIDSYRQAIKLKVSRPEAYCGLGAALEAKGNLKEAIENYTFAIDLDPKCALAYYNSAVVYQQIGNTEEATNNYARTIQIEPHHCHANMNMGIVYHKIGDIKEALAYGLRALELNPKERLAWYNYFFALKADQYPNISLADTLLPSLQSSELQSAKIELSLLEYKLNLGKSAAEASMDKAMTLLGLAKNIGINNPKAPIEVLRTERKLPEKIVALLHFGRSGTGLLHSLIDGHSKISTLPSIYFSEFFDVATWEKLIMNGWEDIPDQFIAMYPVLFDALAPDAVPTAGHKTIANIGGKEGMANLGVNRDEALSIDKVMFKQELWRLMSHYNELDAAIFFQLAHGAYEKAIGNTDDKDILFYHIHNPDTYAKLNFVRLAPNTNWVMMVREPIQSLESWIGKPMRANDHQKIAARIVATLVQVDDPIFRFRNAIGVRLEDLKKSPKKTLRALCNWLGVKEEESLYKMTAQGKMWWGDPSSPDYGKEAMTPFGVNSIERKVGSIFSDNDQFVLRTLFYPFNVKFGYVDENSEQFKSDIREIRPMLDQVFDFEKVIIEETGVNETQFTESGSYRYLRSTMLDRWNMLNEFNSYPNILACLTFQ